jgi:hypothetical protein
MTLLPPPAGAETVGFVEEATDTREKVANWLLARRKGLHPGAGKMVLSKDSRWRTACPGEAVLQKKHKRVRIKERFHKRFRNPKQELIIQVKVGLVYNCTTM